MLANLCWRWKLLKSYKQAKRKLMSRTSPNLHIRLHSSKMKRSLNLKLQRSNSHEQGAGGGAQVAATNWNFLRVNFLEHVKINRKIYVYNYKSEHLLTAHLHAIKYVTQAMLYVLQQLKQSSTINLKKSANPTFFKYWN